MNASVKTVFLREDEIVRGASLSGTQSRRILQRALQSAMGTVDYDRAGTKVFHTAPGATKVRRVIDVDAVIPEPDRNAELIFDEHVDPIVTRAVEHHRDAVIVVAGETGSRRTAVIHGDMPEFTVDVPPRSKWGLAYRVVERLLELSAANPLDITCTFSRVHLDHVSDVLVYVASRIDKSEPEKVRAYYARLVALNHGSTLDFEEAPEGSKVRFQAVDQVEAPIRALDDFLHVINCRGALVAANGPLMKLISKRGVPFYYCLSFSFLPANESALTAKPRRINVVETADLDWQAPDQDAAQFRATFDALAGFGTAIHTRNLPAAESHARATSLTRVALGNLDPRNVDVLVLGTARYSSAFRMMKRIAACRGNRPYVLLHGPDGEGESDVDPELRSHVMAVQDQCETLRREVEQLKRTRDELQFQIQRDDTAISRMREQQTLVSRMTMAAASKPSPGGAGAHGSMGHGHSGAGRRSGHPSPSPGGQSMDRRSESQARRIAQLAALDRDLMLAKEEDARRTEATQQQIRFLQAESRRCAASTQQLERELQQLEKALKEQDARFKLERDQREREMEEKIGAMIAKNKQMLDARNAQRREALQATQDALFKQHENTVKQEKIFLEELQKNTSGLAQRIEAENTAWEAKLDALSRELVLVTQRRDAVQSEAAAAESRFNDEMRALDMEAVVLCKYLNDITNVIWRFENHSSSQVRKVIQGPLCGVPIFDVTARHTPAALEGMCAQVRRWLTAQGVPGPVVYHDIDSNNIEILEEGFQQLMNPSPAAPPMQSPMRAR